MSSTQQTKSFLSKLPAYGKPLTERIKWGNLPMFIFICLGGDAFRSAKNHNKDRYMSAMVLTPGQDPKALIWPVKDCPVIIEWDGSAPKDLIIELVKCLLRALAISVTVYPTWEDFNSPSGYYDSTQQPVKFIQARQIIKTYYPKAVANVA